MIKKTAKYKRKRFVLREDFDAHNPMAQLIRSALPPDSGMDSEAQNRMMGHLYALQRKNARGERAVPVSKLRYSMAAGLAVLVIAALAFAIALPVYRQNNSVPAERENFAGVESLQGDVEIKEPDSDWEEALPGARLSSGTSIRTGEGSTATVLFHEGSKMRMTDGSEASIKKIGTDSILAEHVKGGTYHRVNKGTHYKIVNEEIELRALGTAFNVDSRTKDHLEIITIESAVEVTIGAHKPIKVTQGEVMVVSMAEEMKAAKQSVSRERLEDEWLQASVKQDADEGYNTGIYEQVDVPSTDDSFTAPQQENAGQSISLEGSVLENNVLLDWNIAWEGWFDEVVLLRSESSKPVYPDNRVASYSDSSINSASDDSVQEGKTYQYRIALVSGGQLAAYSNTVVINVPVLKPEPETASVSLVTALYANGAHLEWSVSGAARYEGFVVERVVTKAPENSATPVGSKTLTRFRTNDLFATHLDGSISRGHNYSYRVGLIVDGAVMVYSNKSVVEVPSSQFKP